MKSEGTLMPTTNSIGDWGTALYSSVTNALTMFANAIPRILGFVVILLVGWFIASLVAKAVAVLLRSVHFNELAQRAGLSTFVDKSGVRSDSSGFIAGVVKWFVRLVSLVVAFDALGLPAVSGVLREFLMWLPNLIVALVVLVIGGLAANALSVVVRGATATTHLGNPITLSRVASVAVWAFTIVVAVNQLGIATTLVNTLFMASVWAVAIAGALAFGLGARDTAGEIVRNWYRRSQVASSKAQETLTAAGSLGPQIVGPAISGPGIPGPGIAEPGIAAPLVSAAESRAEQPRPADR
jgi:hypothetical protein